MGLFKKDMRVSSLRKYIKFVININFMEKYGFRWQEYKNLSKTSRSEKQIVIENSN